MSSYASDADLLLRLPELVDIDVTQRDAAREDAAAMIDAELAGRLTMRMHVLMTAHLLAMLPGSPLAANGPVASKSAAEIAVSYAVPQASTSGPHSSSAYGRAFDEIERRVPHAPMAL